MMLLYEYMKHRSGYSLGSGVCWVSIYSGAAGDAPVVVIEALQGRDGEAFSQIAAEVSREHFAAGRDSGHVRPVIWVERSRRRYYLLTFPNRSPVPASMGFVQRHTLGVPKREPLGAHEVVSLIRT